MKWALLIQKWYGLMILIRRYRDIRISRLMLLLLLNHSIMGEYRDRNKPLGYLLSILSRNYYNIQTFSLY